GAGDVDRPRVPEEAERLELPVAYEDLGVVVVVEVAVIGGPHQAHRVGEGAGQAVPDEGGRSQRLGVAVGALAFDVGGYVDVGEVGQHEPPGPGQLEGRPDQLVDRPRRLEPAAPVEHAG